MNLRKKIILFAVVPLLLALLAISLTIHFQSTLLMQQQHMSIAPFYRASKEVELKNYVALAEQAIAPFYEGTEVEEVAKEKARVLLKKMKFGDDGYFFVNDFDGKIIVQPNQPEREGKNQIDRTDSNGILIIQKLISLARNGGGFVEYTMEKPSVRQIAPKLAYVIALPKWGWVLGTGIYLDDVDSALGRIETQASVNVTHTMLWIIAISFLSVIAIFLGLMRNIRERTALDDKLGLANAELQVLTAKLSLTNSELTALAQEIMIARSTERERIKSELHDGIQQKLFASNIQLDIAMKTLSHVPEKSSRALNSIKELLNELHIELRRIVEGIVDPDLDLKAGLAKLALDMSQPTRLIKVIVDGEITDITIDSKRVLELFAREALVNIVKHADAHQIEIRLESSPQLIKLEICDDGRGFDVVNNCIGHGLRNMKERLESAGGSLTINSRSAGTCLTGILPLT